MALLTAVLFNGDLCIAVGRLKRYRPPGPRGGCGHREGCNDIGRRGRQVGVQGIYHVLDTFLAENLNLLLHVTGSIRAHRVGITFWQRCTKSRLKA